MTHTSTARRFAPFFDARRWRAWRSQHRSPINPRRNGQLQSLGSRVPSPFQGSASRSSRGGCCLCGIGVRLSCFPPERVVQDVVFAHLDVLVMGCREYWASGPQQCRASAGHRLCFRRGQRARPAAKSLAEPLAPVQPLARASVPPEDQPPLALLASFDAVPGSEPDVVAEVVPSGACRWSGCRR